MVVEEEILSKKSVSKLAECIYRDFDTWVNWRNELVHGYRPQYRDLGEVVRGLKSWRANNDVSDEQLQAFVILFLALLVENDIEGRFEKLLSDKFRSLVSSAGK